MKSILGYFIFFSMVFSACSQKSPLPNIIVFIADDLGYGDLGCYGSQDIKTPNIDKLASQGVRLINFYSNGPECSPTRVAFMTGKYQQRVGGLECAIGAGNVGRYDEAEWLASKNELGLPPNQNILLDHLVSAGYETAILGKWHLGYEQKFRPGAHGFEYSFGPIGYGGDYFYHTEQVETGLDDLTGRHTLMENNKEVFHTGRYFTDLITQKALAWLKTRKNNRPFFLYLPYTAPHTPYQGTDDLINRPLTADEWNKGTRETYVKMVESLDTGIGDILSFLNETDWEKETLVLFFSDNGGAGIADNGPFSGTKGSVYEGGIHVPCIIKWPGKLAQNLISRHPSLSFDLTASILRIIDPENDQTLDGIDIIDHIANNHDDMERTFFWRLKRGQRVRKAIRQGKWKYIARVESDTLHFEKLFNLAHDLAEENNLTNQYPAVINSLREELDGWEKEVQSPRLKPFMEMNRR